MPETAASDLFEMIAKMIPHPGVQSRVMSIQSGIAKPAVTSTPPAAPASAGRC